MTLESTMRWLVGGALALVVPLFVWTAVAQEAPSVNKELRAQTATTPQPNSAAPSKTELGAPRAKAQPEASKQPKVEVKADAGATTPNATLAEEPVIQSRKDKVSYAFGVDLARDLKRQKSDLNVDLVMRAMTDALADKPLIMTDDEVTATLKHVEAEQKQDFEHAKMMISEKNKKAGETFFAENAKKEGVVTLPSGLQYKILKKGDGATPTTDDRVTCQYRATLLDGTEFDSSEKRGHAVTFPVRGVMPGWTQALQMMPIGSKWQLFLPPQLAYGDKVVNGIGPNATLIFEVELVSIEEKPQTVGAK